MNQRRSMNNPPTPKRGSDGFDFAAKMFFISALVLACICVAGILITLVVFYPPTQLAAPVAQPTAPSSERTPGSPAGGESWYQVYFTSPQYPDKPENRRGGLDEKLTAFINSATQSVDMAIYQLDLPNVVQALIEAKKRGLTVRIVTDSDTLDSKKENPAFKQLESAGIKVVGGNPHAIMHNKFVVVDNAAVWTGSWNFTTNDTYRYNNNGIQIHSPALARNYTATFEKMFVDNKFSRSRKPGGTTPRLTIDGITVENYFAPEDKVADKIVARLKLAQQEIIFMAFSFTDDRMGDTILERWKNGVKVRGVFEKTGSQTRFSEFGRLKAGGLDVYEDAHSETQVSQDGNPYLMHHKVFVIDNKTVILGSYNFSENANEENDENVLIIDAPGLAAQFAAEFLRVFEQAKNPPKK